MQPRSKHPEGGGAIVGWFVTRGVRGMVGADRVDRPVAQPLDQRLDICASTQRRINLRVRVGGSAEQAESLLLPVAAGGVQPPTRR